MPWKSFSPAEAVKAAKSRYAARIDQIATERYGFLPASGDGAYAERHPWTQPGAPSGRSGGRFGSNHSATDRRRRHQGAAGKSSASWYDSETEVFRTQFLRHLRELGAAWQRRLGPVRPKRLRRHPEGVGGGGRRDDPYHLRPAPPDFVRTQLDTVADMLGRQSPEVKVTLMGAKEDLTAFVDFPHQHWKKIQSTNPLERLRPCPTW